MTHFVGAVLVPADVAEDEYLNTVLERYSENREVEPYISSERDEWKEEVQKAKEAMPDVVARAREKVTSPQPWDVRMKDYNETEAQKYERQQSESGGWSDQQWLDWWSGEGSWKPRRELAGGFDRWTTYNPESRWDWWVIGGRWEGVYSPSDRMPAKQALELLADQNPDREENWKFPQSLVNLAGEWLRHGRVGWWGMHAEEMPAEDWQTVVTRELELAPEGTFVVFIDFHI